MFTKKEVRMFAFILFLSQDSYAFEWDIFKERYNINGFQFGVCTGLSTNCVGTSLKIGITYEFIGINASIGKGVGTASLRLYPNIRFPIRPYFYTGYLFVPSFLGLGHSPGAGVGVDIHIGHLLIQPAIGIVISTGRSYFDSTISFMVKL